MRSPSLQFIAAVVAASAACGGGNVASNLAQAPQFQPKGQTKCSVASSQARPLIVEWPSADRLTLENKIREGIVAVRYQGCEMDVLERCSVPAGYKYLGATRSQDSVVMRDEDDLYANLPVGAAHLEAKLARSGQLTVDMDLVGRFESERPTVRADELQGDCAGATHFVYGIAVGAFDFYAGADADVGGSAGIGALGGGAHSQAQRETLTKNGDRSACDKSRPDDKSPPAECGALIRIEVVALGGSNAPQSAAVVAGAAPAPPPPPAPLARSGRSCPSEMASVAGGSFTMGDRHDGVTVQPFCLDVTEVTVDAYATCVRGQRCSTEHVGSFALDGIIYKPDASCNYGVGGRGNHPMNCVDLGQAAAYCLAQGKRLPTEEEWEWAARGAGQGRTYPWGNEPPGTQLCWSGVRKQDGTCPVGGFPAGDAPGGIHDLAGNAWEWTSSPFSADARVVRGGSWDHDDPKYARAAFRMARPPAYRSRGLGFRCAG